MNKRVLSILILAAALRFSPALWNQPLWGDEAYTALLLRGTFSGLPTSEKASIIDIIAVTSGDVHPPLYYMFPWISTRLLSESEFSLRLPSAILGMLAVYLTWRLGYRLLSERAALIGAALLAISPFAIYHSNEARMYALLMCEVLLVAVGIVECDSWFISIGIAWMLVTHNMAVIYVPFLALLCWRYKRGVLAFVPGGALWLVWLPIALQQVRRIDGNYWIEEWVGILPLALLENIRRLLFGHFFIGWLVIPTAIVSCALIVWPLINVLIKREHNPGFLATMAFGPMLAMLSISAIWQPMILYRVLAGSLPPFLLLVAWWVADLPRRWDLSRLTWAGLICLIFMINTAHYYIGADRTYGWWDVIVWVRNNVGVNEILCHKVGMIAYYTNHSSDWELASCDVLLARRRAIGSNASEPVIYGKRLLGIIQIEDWEMVGGIGSLDDGGNFEIEFWRRKSKAVQSY